MLASAAAVEKPGRPRRSLEHSLCMLRDGFIFTPESDGTCFLWMNIADGSVGKSIAKAELDARGIDQVVTEFRASRMPVAR